jgi:hypothetical protein
MLTKVEVRTETGMLLVLPLDDISDGFGIEDITGLDPVKATLVSSAFANVDGSHYHSSRREPRNILLTVVLEPDYAVTTVRELRKTLYSYFMPKAAVSLRFFMEDGLTVDISGIVESFNAELFTKEPKATISVMCFDPDFIELESVVVEGDTVADTTEFLIEYEGTVETGITFVLNVDRTLTEFTIYHKLPNDQIVTLDFSAALEADDVLTITTIPGSKAVTLVRDATLTSVLYGMSPQSNWIELKKGENYLRVYAVGDPIPFTIEYTTRHGGL